MNENIYIYIYIYIYACVCVHIYTCTHTHTHIYLYCVCVCVFSSKVFVIENCLCIMILGLVIWHWPFVARNPWTNTLEKGIQHIISQLQVKLFHTRSSTGVALALNNTQYFISYLKHFEYIIQMKKKIAYRNIYLSLLRTSFHPSNNFIATMLVKLGCPRGVRGSLVV